MSNKPRDTDKYSLSYSSQYGSSQEHNKPFNSARPNKRYPSNRPPRKNNRPNYHSTRNNNFNYNPHAERSTEPNAKLELELFENDNVVKGINFDQYADIEIEVTGGNAPPMINDFREVDNIHPQLLWNIERSGYTDPTPVQKQTFPIAVEGIDIMAVAQTGSGKTAAFLLPMIQMLMETGGPSRYPFDRRTSSLAPIAVILTPTRELTSQVQGQARKFLYRTGMRSGVAYGGTRVGEQLRQLRSGVDILVATPGRLVDFLDRGEITLNAVRFFVLDEADRMLDMGFEEQIRAVLSPQYGMPKPGNRQTMMFSATFPRPIQNLAKSFMGKNLFVKVGRVGGAADTVRQELVYVQSSNKRSILMDVWNSVEDGGSVLLFVQRKVVAGEIERYLCNKGVNAMSIHGDKSQDDREYAIDSFRKGVIKVLVATDVASRGLDIPNVSYVINYDMTSNIDDYVHRIGRTGRIGNTGVALSIITELEGSKILQELLTLMEEGNQVIPEWLPEIIALRKKERRTGPAWNRGGKNRRGSNFSRRRMQF